MKIYQFIIGLSLMSLPSLIMAQGSDCANAQWINTNESSHINVLDDIGEETILNDVSCREEGLPETHPVWLQFQTTKSGLLAFNIIPDKPNDDLDFVLYQLPEGSTDCNYKIPIRCMAAGPRIGANKSESTSCLGSTGLRKEETDRTQSTGCNSNANNYLAAVPTTSGDTYTLWVNNYSSNQGFTLEFTGEVVLAEQSYTPSEFPIKAFPNPSNGDFQLEFLMPAAGEATVYAFNASGQQIYLQKHVLAAGQQQLLVPAASWASGLYWLGVLADGERRFLKVEKI